MKLFNIFKKKQPKQLTKEEKIDLLWKAFISDKTTSPLTQIMTFVSNLGACGHSDFFTLLKTDEKLLDCTTASLPLLPKAIQENFLKAKTLFDSEPNKIEQDDFLSEYDEFFYDNEDLIDDLLLCYSNCVK